MDEVGELKLTDLEQQLHQLFDDVFEVVGRVDPNKSRQFAEILKQDNLNINVQDDDGRTLFMKAVRYIPASLNIIKILLAHRQFNVNIVDNAGDNTLCYLPCAHPDTDPSPVDVFWVYKQLILKGINVNNRNIEGQIALVHRMCFTCRHDFDLQQMLVTDDSDIFYRNAEDVCAYDYALHRGEKYLVMMNRHLLKLAMTAEYLLILPRDIREYIKLFHL